MSLFGDLFLAGVSWIRFADQGNNTADLASWIADRFPETRQRGGTVSIAPLIMDTVRVAIAFDLDRQTRVIFSAGVTGRTAPRLIEGWSNIGVASVLGANYRSDRDAAKILRELPDTVNKHSLYLIGHSGGGALVEALVNRIARLNTQPLIYIATIGAPAALVTGHALNPRSIQRCRCINIGDPVPGLPFCGATTTTAFSWANSAAGATFEPWRFQHPTHAVQIGDPALVAPQVVFAPPASTLPSSSALIDWLTGDDGRIGHPHSSTAYDVRLTRGIVEQVITLGDRAEPIAPPEPRTISQGPAPDTELVPSRSPPISVPIQEDPPFLVMRMVQDEPANDQVMALPQIGELEPKQFDKNDLQPTILQRGNAVQIPPEGRFHAHTHKGQHFVSYRGVIIRYFGTRGNSERAARTLNKALERMISGTGDPGLMGSAILSFLGSLPEERLR